MQALSLAQDTLKQQTNKLSDELQKLNKNLQPSLIFITQQNTQQDNHQNQQQNRQKTAAKLQQSELQDELQQQQQWSTKQ